MLALMARICLVILFFANARTYGQTPFNKPFGLGGASLKSPICTDGAVTAMALYLKRFMYIGGGFSQLGPCSGSGIPLNLLDGLKVSTFDWATMGVNGTVGVAIPDTNGSGWYIGGNFTAIGSTSIRGLAKIAGNGAIDPTFNANLDDSVGSLFLDPGTSTLYLGGSFKSVGATSRPYLAAVNSITGALINGFDSGVNEPVNAITGSGSNLYIGGYFSRTAAQVREDFALFDIATGALKASSPLISGNIGTSVSDGAGGWYIGGFFQRRGAPHKSSIAHILANGSLSAWDPMLTGSPNITVRAMALNGNTLYIGGDFTGVHSGSLVRNRLAAIDLTTGTATAWNPNIGGGSNPYVTSLVISGSNIYVGGDFTTVNGSTTRNRLAAIDLTTGTATAWNPNIGGGSNPYVTSLVISGSNIYVGGDFTTVNGSTTRNRLAAINLTTGTATSWNPNIDEAVQSLVIVGSTVYVSGSYFTTVNGSTTRNHLAAIDLTTGTATAWNPDIANSSVSSIASDGSTLFVGGFLTSVGGIKRSGLAALNATTGITTAWNPDISGAISTMAIYGTTLYAGGYISTVNGGSTPRNSLAAFDLTTGTATAWNPDVQGSYQQVNSILISGGTLYAGGDFTLVNGSISRKSLAAFDLTTGTATAWDPNIDTAYITSLASSGGTIYVGGYFSLVNGSIPRSNLAAFDNTSGIATSWNPNMGGAPFTLATNGSTLYAGGEFTVVNGANRNHLAAIDLVSGGIMAWNPNIANNTYVGIESIIISGSTIYVGGHFTTVNGSTTRNNLTAFDLTTGTVTAWNPNIDGGSAPYVTALATSGSTIYLGGEFTTVNGSTTRNSLAAIDLTTGTATAWNPNIGGSNPTVLSLAISGSTIYVGGQFTTVNGSTNRNNLAAIDLTTGTATPWNPNIGGSYPYVTSLATSGTTIYVGGEFTTVNGSTNRNNLAAIDLTSGTATAWNPTSGTGSSKVGPMAISDGNIYALWSSTTDASYVGLVAFSLPTGIPTFWNPNLLHDVSSSRSAMLIDGGTLYFGGKFSTVNNKIRANFCPISLSTGLPIPE